ncbi:hypothetical protein JY430_13345 [Stenotrophomonas maltophilia]|nr:hypothetical protein [Stenotrophomonas maltophilia]
MSESRGLSIAERLTLATLRLIAAGGSVDTQTAQNLFTLKLVTTAAATQLSAGGEALMDLLETREKAYFGRLSIGKLLSDADELDLAVAKKEEDVQRLTYQPMDPYFSDRIERYRLLTGQSEAAAGPQGSPPP